MLHDAKKMLAGALLAFGIHAHCEAAFDIFEIPTLGGDVVVACDINKDNIVVGYSTTPGEKATRAFRYNANTGVLEHLGSLSSHHTTQAIGCDSRGDVVGASGHHAFLLQANSNRMQSLGLSEKIPFQLGFLTPESSSAIKISDNTVCGFQSAKNEYGISFRRPMFWSKATGMMDLGTPQTGNGNGVALSMNDRLMIVGETMDRNGQPQATVWTLKHDIKDMLKVAEVKLLDGFPEGTVSSSAAAINDHSHIVGHFVDAQGCKHAFVWKRNSGIKDLGTLPGDTSATAQAINNHGIVAGVSFNALSQEECPFAWNPELGMIELGLEATARESAVVTAINDEGIVSVVLGNMMSYLIHTKNLK